MPCRILRHLSHRWSCQDKATDRSPETPRVVAESGETSKYLRYFYWILHEFTVWICFVPTIQLGAKSERLRGWRRSIWRHGRRDQNLSLRWLRRFSGWKMVELVDFPWISQSCLPCLIVWIAMVVGFPVVGFPMVVGNQIIQQLWQFHSSPWKFSHDNGWA